MSKTFTFTVELQGTGQTQEEAWIDAVDSFACDPGEPQEVCEEMLFEYEEEEVYPLSDDDTDTLDLN